jgi:hypothetical protein
MKLLTQVMDGLVHQLERLGLRRVWGRVEWRSSEYRRRLEQLSLEVEERISAHRVSWLTWVTTLLRPRARPRARGRTGLIASTSIEK